MQNNTYKRFQKSLKVLEYQKKLQLDVLLPHLSPTALRTLCVFVFQHHECMKRNNDAHFQKVTTQTFVLLCSVVHVKNDRDSFVPLLNNTKSLQLLYLHQVCSHIEMKTI